MARKVPVAEVRPVASNPSFFGVNLEDNALKAIGLAGTATFNDIVLQPVAGKLVPGGMTAGTVGKLVNAASTLVSAWALSKVVGMVDQHIANQIEAGGFILGVGRGIMAVFPGLSISGNLALPAGVPVFGKAAALAALPAAGATNGGTPSLTTSGTMSGRYPPNPTYGSVTPQFAVGL